jgi:hypothetical protein
MERHRPHRQGRPQLPFRRPGHRQVLNFDNPNYQKAGAKPAFFVAPITPDLFATGGTKYLGNIVFPAQPRKTPVWSRVWHRGDGNPLGTRL